MRARRLIAKLEDCLQHGAGVDNELFVVEGDSAAGNVVRVRNQQYQAVLPMQGKPMNAHKAGAAKVVANPWFAALITALGCGVGDRFDATALRYRRVVLLFDPDADGIHSGALMLIFLHTLMPALLENGHVWMVRAPLLRVSAATLTVPRYAASEAHYRALLAELQREHGGDIQTLRYRGLGSLEAGLLIDYCVARATRQAQPMGVADAQMALQYFGGPGQTLSE